MDKNNYKHKPGHSLYESLKKKTKKTPICKDKKIFENHSF